MRRGRRAAIRQTVCGRSRHDSAVNRPGRSSSCCCGPAGRVIGLSRLRVFPQTPAAPAWRVGLNSPVVARCAGLALILAGCASAPRPVDPRKLCAEALVTLSASAECTALSPNICIFTMTDLERARDAGANKQAYCPRLQDGQDAANN